MAGLTFEIPAEVVERIVELVALEVVAELAASHESAPQPEFLTIDEACATLRCNRQRIYDLRSQGRLTRFGDGSRVLVSAAELRDHIENGGG